MPISLFSNSMARLPPIQHTSTEIVSVFQHNANTLPNIRNYRCEPLQIQCTLIITLSFKRQHKGGAAIIHACLGWR